jgi:uncharacterized protein (TIRG00374 family)
MVSREFKFTWKTLLLPAIGIVVFLLYIYIFGVDIFEIISMLKGINLYLYLLAAVLLVFDTFFFTVAWYFLLRFLSVKLSLAKSFLFVWFGTFMDILIPAESISGEISKIYLVTREQNGTAGKVTASLVIQRLIGMITNVLSLTLGASLLLIEKQLSGLMLNLTLTLATLTFFFLLLLLLLCVKENWTLRVVRGIINFAEWISRGRWKLTKIRTETLKAAKAFHSAIREFRGSPKIVVVASFFSTVSWILALLVFYLSILAIGYTSISIGAILVIFSIFIAIKSIPLGIPFEVGFPEITLTTLLILVGMPPQTSATATIAIRILTLWLRFFIGFTAQQWLGIKSVQATDTKTQKA